MGGLEAAFYFCPIRGVSKEEMLLFRRHGFQIVIAQSVKEGEDRVDQSMEAIGRLLLKNPDIGTIMILSEDRDFSDLVSFGIGNGKKVPQFRVDIYQGVLRSTDYTDTIPIPTKSGEIIALTKRPRTVWQRARI